MSSEILINASPLETRVALLENNVLTELYIEREREKGIVGNVYKGVVSKVLPGMQAAFVEIGLEKDGFLYVADVDRADGRGDYDELIEEEEEEKEEAEVEPKPPRRKGGRGYARIQDLLKEGQEIAVQVSKDPIGSKGCRLTSYITLPGRYLVCMPTVSHLGVSRRIEDERERKRLRDTLRRLSPKGVGFIVRTAAEGAPEEDFQADIEFLTKLWEDIRARAREASAPALLHPDLKLAHRVLRDLYTAMVSRVVIDSPEEYDASLKFARSYLPAAEKAIKLYEGKQPIFEARGIEQAIEEALGRKVWLKSGGYIVIDPTEALVTIDVNTGRFVGKRDPEETILKTNLEAMDEIVYQLRLRNFGGIIIIDFIDMEKRESREKLFAAFEAALKVDRSRTNILRVSELGLVQMTRKRVRESLSRVLCAPCPYCDGRGSLKSATTICYEVLREVERAARSLGKMRKILITVHPSVADLLMGEESPFVEQIEKKFQKKVIVKADYDLHLEQYDLFYV